MPHSTIHRKKRFQNYAVLGAIVALVFLIFLLSIVRMEQSW